MSAVFTYQRDVTARFGAVPVLPCGEEVIRVPGREGMRAHIAELEGRMLAMPEHQIVIEPVHCFAQGLYAREVTLPAGCTATGHIHGQEHICIISKGRVLVVTDEGAREFAAPATMIVPAGRKNCVHALEETVWTTIHATEARTPEEAEAMLILPDYPELGAH